MNMHTTICLGLAMATIALLNASLMAWLWRFPMAPDPTGRDPHGVSTAPRSWANVHRALGYVFVLIYLVLLWEMIPRSWEFRIASSLSILHGAMGLLIGVLLVVKIAIIRRFRRFGNRLPFIGGTLAVTTVVMVALVVPPAWQVAQPLAALSPKLAQGRDIVTVKCIQCHGASVIASEREDARKWDRITREMQAYSEKMPDKTPILESERILATAYLVRTLAEDKNSEDQDLEENEIEDDATDFGGKRRRRRRDH